jgi:hypothetical protein
MPMKMEKMTISNAMIQFNPSQVNLKNLTLQ